jgi:hypothetical protein
MNRASSLSVFIGALALVSGCASKPSLQAEPITLVDQTRVERIERTARHMGLKVYWYNKPTIEVIAKR